MTYTKLITATALLGAIAVAASADAGDQRAAGRRAAAPPRGVGQAVPRVGPAPRVIDGRFGGRLLPSRPYFYRPYYRPAVRLGIGIGYGYPYGSYGYPYGYGSYGYPAYGYGSYGYPAYGYPYAYGVRPYRAYGGVRITDAPRDAEVLVDGYYAGIVDDFDGVFQHLDLEAGPHRIEIRARGYQPIAFDVRVEPGQTITYRAGLRH